MKYLVTIHREIITTCVVEADNREMAYDIAAKNDKDDSVLKTETRIVDEWDDIEEIEE